MIGKPMRSGAYAFRIRLSKPIIESEARITFACLSSFKRFDTKMRPHPAGTPQYKIMRIRLLHSALESNRR